MIIPSRRIPLVLSAIALAVVASPLAFAQSAQPVQEVLVLAFRPVITTGHDVKGRPVKLIQLRRRVSYADLNIATYSGATELQKRIDAAARAVCQELERDYPFSTEGGLPSGSCVTQAINSAMPQANAAIAAAEQATLREAQAQEK